VGTTTSRGWRAASQLTLRRDVQEFTPAGGRLRAPRRAVHPFAASAGLVDHLVADRAAWVRVEARELTGHAAGQLVDRAIAIRRRLQLIGAAPCVRGLRERLRPFSSVISVSAVCQAAGNGTPARRAASSV
jgi:hypothetical protein